MLGKPEIDVMIRGLAKGMYVSPDEIEAMVDERRDTDAYKLRVLSLIDRIHSLRVELEAPVVARCEDHGIRILTDSEASEYLDKRHRCHMAGMDRAHHRTCRWVEISRLTEDERKNHDRRRMRQALIDQALAPIRALD